ncbi:hypothetical protein OKW98_18720 [Pseudomonas sp. KU26590]|uniref:hypothetical protein n=1 Tax=Pseudomonas sp. KU26590 TaxID=2991051 RepID=UPI00223E711F|nr:hypothetical protein [Pseudomonas sp. KU26590]UZJ58612.1 hypothetical protein OKW98_18720 [Pseudomonas sp. KU26590]
MTVSRFTSTTINRAADLHTAGVKWAALQAEFGDGIIMAVKAKDRPCKVCTTCDTRNAVNFNFCCKCGFLL